MRALTFLFLSCFFLNAAEPVLSKRGELIFEDPFAENLKPIWKSSKGLWEVKDGRLVGQEPDGNNHAVHLSDFQEYKGNLIIEFEMLITSNDAEAGIMFHPGKGSSLKGHLGRATLTGKYFRIRRDKSEAVKKERFRKPPVGQWFHLILELVDDTMTAQFNEKSYTIKHEDFQKAYNKKFMLIAGKTVEYKNFKVYKAVAEKD